MLPLNCSSLIPQQGSWGPLVVDGRSIRKILTAFEIFPAFIDLLRSFGRRIDFTDDSAGGYYLRTCSERSVYGEALLIKGVALLSAIAHADLEQRHVML